MLSAVDLLDSCFSKQDGVYAGRSMDCRLQPLPGVLHLTTKSFKRVLQHTAPERGEGAARHGKHLHRVGVLEVALVGSGGSPWEKWHTVPRRTDLDGLGCPVNVRGEWALLSWSVGGWVGWLIGRSIGCLVAWSVAGFGCLPTHPYTYRESQRFTQHLRDTKTQVYKNIQACARTEFPWRPQAILTGPTPGPETRREAVSRITPTRLPTGRASSCRGNCTSSCVCVCALYSCTYHSGQSLMPSQFSGFAPQPRMARSLAVQSRCT